MSKLSEDDDASLPSGSDLSDDEELSYVGDNNGSEDENDIDEGSNVEEEEEEDDDLNNDIDDADPDITFGNSIKNPNIYEDNDSEGYSEDEDIQSVNVINTLYSSDESTDDTPDQESSSLGYDDDDDTDEDETYNDGEKITDTMRQNILDKYHPESNVVSREEIYELCEVTRNSQNIIIDKNHRTSPILTKYEKTKILGLRAKQINNGAKPLVNLPTNLHDVNESTIQQLQDKHFDGYLVALEELKQKKIPVIIRRPLPNGVSEYWPLQELEVYM